MAKVALQRVREIALSLTRADRAQPTHELLESLDESDDAGASGDWGSEVLKRLAEVEHGRVALVDVEEVLRRVRGRIQAERS